MSKSLRRTVSALAIAAALLALASPVEAAPNEEPDRAASLTSPSLFTELWAWLGQWFGGEALPSLRPLVGETTDPDGETEAPSPPGTGEVGGPTTQGSHTMDPDG